MPGSAIGRVRRTWRCGLPVAVGVLAVAAGCGRDNDRRAEVGESFRSGRRLTGVAMTAEGMPPRLVAIWDTAHDVRCTFRQIPDGRWYCLPPVAFVERDSLGGLRFSSDAECKKRDLVFTGFEGRVPAVATVIEADGTFRVFEVSAALPREAYGLSPTGDCQSEGMKSGLVLLGDELPINSFARGRVEQAWEARRNTRLAQLHIWGTDGSFWPASLYDTHYEAECHTRGSRPRTRRLDACYPTLTSFAVVWTSQHENCDNPTPVAYGHPGKPPDYAAVVEANGTTQIWTVKEEPIDAPYVQLSPTSECERSGSSFFSPVEAFPLQEQIDWSLPAVTWELRGTKRLQDDRLVDSEGHLLAEFLDPFNQAMNWPFFDTKLGISCRSIATPEGGKCLPWTVARSVGPLQESDVVTLKGGPFEALAESGRPEEPFSRLLPHSYFRAIYRVRCAIGRANDVDGMGGADGTGGALAGLSSDRLDANGPSHCIDDLWVVGEPLDFDAYADLEFGLYPD